MTLELGVPYARGEWDAKTGDIVRTCPVDDCGATFREYYDPKADMGCGAMVSDYPDHYVEVHRAAL